MIVHMMKMAVGVDDVRHLADIQAGRRRRAETEDGTAALRHFTRHVPRRRGEILDGGSMFWVIKGFIRVRQAILGVEPGLDIEGRRRCALVLDPCLVATELCRMRRFQGWRYLHPDSAPADRRAVAGGADHLPTDMAAELRELGLI